jgi:tRNA pseudouridine13 synthase
LYEFSGDGEHLMIQVRKKDLTTWTMIDTIARHLGTKARDIGYAGLKDKNAMTIQYISCHKSYEDKLATFKDDKIKILNTTYHKNKLKIGHLKANKFFIRLKQVQKGAVPILLEAIKQIDTNGMANYFGYQRFGIDGDNHEKGRLILEGKLKERNIKLKKLFLSAYQSYNFNMWLSKRVEISSLVRQFKPAELVEQLSLDIDTITNMKNQTLPFKLLSGDVMSHYPHGRLFLCEDMLSEADRFVERTISPTGLLIGQKTTKAQNFAKLYEDRFDSPTDKLNGARRYAWVFPTDISSRYNEDKKHLELEFTLPKGSYATEFIWHICG